MITMMIGVFEEIDNNNNNNNNNIFIKVSNIISFVLYIRTL